MGRLRDCSEIKEAAELLDVLLAARQAASKTSREERLRRCLKDTCARGGFRTAVVSDAQGLPFVIHGSSANPDAIAAVVTLLGNALDRVGRVLDAPDVNHIALDVGIDERTVVRRFTIDDQFHYLLVVARQDGDVRAEMELSIPQIVDIVRERRPEG